MTAYARSGPWRTIFSAGGRLQANAGSELKRHLDSFVGFVMPEMQGDRPGWSTGQLEHPTDGLALLKHGFNAGAVLVEHRSGAVQKLVEASRAPTGPVKESQISSCPWFWREGLEAAACVTVSILPLKRPAVKVWPLLSCSPLTISVRSPRATLASMRPPSRCGVWLWAVALPHGRSSEHHR